MVIEVRRLMSSCEKSPTMMSEASVLVPWVLLMGIWFVPYRGTSRSRPGGFRYPVAPVVTGQSGCPSDEPGRVGPGVGGCPQVGYR